MQCDRIEATTCWRMAFAAMRAARATHLGPTLRLRAYPGIFTATIGGQPDPRAFLGIVDVVAADGSHAHYNVYLDAEGRFAAMCDAEELSKVGPGGVSS